MAPESTAVIEKGSAGSLDVPPDRIVARGARVNALGVLARTAQPLAFALLTRWYGPDEMGVYLLAAATLETFAALATSGLQDGVLAFVSPLVPDSEGASRLLASAFLMAAAAASLAGLAVAAAALAAPAWLPQPGTGPALSRMAPALPLYCYTGVVVAATRTRFIQTYDVLLQGVSRPALIILFAWLASTRETSAASLAFAYLAAHVVLALLATLVLVRHFAWRHLAAAMRTWPLERRLAAFALPQNLNLALHALTGSASVLALGMAGLPPRDIALFGAALAIASSLRQVRLVFTSAMAPVAASLHAGGRRDELQAVMTRASRWSLALALPAALAIVVFRGPLLRLFHPSYQVTLVTMILLVAAPLLNTVAGFASNALVMAGFVGWNLFNTAVAVTTTFGFCWLLAPSLGVAGAAAAAAASGLLVSALQLFEGWRLVGVVPRPWGGRGPARRAGAPQ